MADGEDGFGKIGKKNAAERSTNAHAAFLVGRESLLFPIKQPYPVKHPGSLDILGNPAFPLYKRDVVDFLKAFPAQFIGKFFHIAVELPVPRGVCPFRSAPRGTQSY